ncbi:MAG: restriction endonuclease subunit M [Candidatus Altiarchaeales archaeon A3]|nr:MAG: restriction endonuclease subunit M [Candidatus Altiarchaeales archaeon A3]
MQLQNWLKERYKILFAQFQEREFEREDAVRVLTEMFKDDEKSVNVVLSELRKPNVHLLDVNFNQSDARRSIYKLRKIEGIREILSKNTLTRGDIEVMLKKAADLVRTRVDYKFILVLLFLKRISDKWDVEFKQRYDELISDGFSGEEAKDEAKHSSYHDFDVPEEFLWDNIRKDTNQLSEQFSKALKVLSERNPELKDILGDVDFIQFASNKENAEILHDLVEVFSAKRLDNVSPDILGDAYEWILSYFAPQKAKEGEVYTPREVIWLLVNILMPKENESVYDPASASNGMLIISYKYVENLHGKETADKIFLYGQEANPKTTALGMMNLYIHGIENHHIMQGDTLLYPKFKNDDESGIKKFNIVIANPPWNQDGYDEEKLKKGSFWMQRFKYGFSPKQSADWAWIQHMLASADENTGMVGVVIDNGCLFRGGKEEAIRAKILECDLIECVILLPEKLFYNTGAPGAIMILNKNKVYERKGKILFINASNEFEKHPEVRKLNILAEKNIKAISEIYKNFKETDGFSRVVSLDEIKQNDYNLNVTLYVFPEEKEEEIDVHSVWEELKEKEEEIEEIEGKIEKFLKEIM